MEAKLIKHKEWEEAQSTGFDSEKWDTTPLPPDKQLYNCHRWQQILNDSKRLLVLENTRIWKLRCDAFKSCTKEVLSVWSGSCCTAGQPQSSVRTETNSRGAAPASHCVNMAWWEPSKTRGRSSTHAIVSEKNSNNTGTWVTLEERAPLRIKTRRWWCHKQTHLFRSVNKLYIYILYLISLCLLSFFYLHKCCCNQANFPNVG